MGEGEQRNGTQEDGSEDGALEATQLSRVSGSESTTLQRDQDAGIPLGKGYSSQIPHDKQFLGEGDLVMSLTSGSQQTSAVSAPVLSANFLQENKKRKEISQTGRALRPHRPTVVVLHCRSRRGSLSPPPPAHHYQASTTTRPPQPPPGRRAWGRRSSMAERRETIVQIHHRRHGRSRRCHGRAGEGARGCARGEEVVAAAFGEEGSTQSRRSCLVDSAVLVLVDLAATVLEMRGRCPCISHCHSSP